MLSYFVSCCLILSHVVLLCLMLSHVVLWGIMLSYFVFYMIIELASHLFEGFSYYIYTTYINLSSLSNIFTGNLLSTKK